MTIKDNKGNIIHTPIEAHKIPEEMAKLIDMINKDPDQLQIINALDIHHYFEWIHPFSDGNGRTGRILFALLLSKYRILEIPASIFSYSIKKHKEQYYQALRYADNNNKNQYYQLMLNILNESLELALSFIKEIQKKMEQAMDIDNKRQREVIKYLFAGVKTSNRYLVKKTGLNNKTISKYIDEFIAQGWIVKHRYNKYISYKNLILEKTIYKIFKEL